MHLTIGSRGSDLALYQANLVARLLGALGVTTDIKIIKTVGDKIDNVSFDKIEGKGFFTKELEDALLAREIDLAVHSLKDLSTQMPEGLKVGAYLNPEDPSELLLVKPESVDKSRPLFIKAGAVIGTSSVRRQAQITYIRPDLVIEPLRGNVPTRLRKLRDEKYDAILIAHAGVHRLGLSLDGLESFKLDRMEFIPAPGQGILTVEIRDNDSSVESAIAGLNERAAEETALLERGLLARFQGGCQLPLAVTSERRGKSFFIMAFLGVKDGDAFDNPATFEGESDTIDSLIEKAFSSLKAASSDYTHKKKVLITRAEAEAALLFEPYREKLEPVYYPVFSIVPSHDDKAFNSALAGLERFNWIIFTSKNSVNIFFELLKEQKASLPRNIKLAAVGMKTAELLKSYGFKEIFVPQKEDSAGLVNGLSGKFGGKLVSILLPQGEEAPSTLVDDLKALGHRVTRLNIYKTLPTEPGRLPDISIDDIDFFVFTSPLSVAYFKALGHKIPGWLAAIGMPTAKALADHFRAPDFVPEKADLEDIMRNIWEQV